MVGQFDEFNNKNMSQENCKSVVYLYLNNFEALMQNIFFLMLFFLGSCSQIKQKEFQDVPVRVTDAQVDECLDYKKEVLDNVYSEIKVESGSDYIFTKSLSEARSSFQKFDLSKSLIKSKVTMINNILNSCNEEKIKKFNEDFKIFGRCSLMNSELNYFQALAKALGRPWPMILKLEGKKLAVDYVRYFSAGRFPLLERVVALSVLDELSINQVINKDLHNEIKTLMLETHYYVESLKHKINQESHLSCESAEVIRLDLEYSDVVGKKMRDLLRRI